LLYFSSYKDKKFSEQQTMQFFAQPVFKDWENNFQIEVLHREKNISSIATIAWFTKLSTLVLAEKLKVNICANQDPEPY
jgi:hypothetical protein